MFRTSLFSDHTYPFSFFYTFVVLERIHGVCHMSFIACSVEAGRVHVFDDLSATFEVRSFKSIHIHIKTHNKFYVIVALCDIGDMFWRVI